MVLMQFLSRFCCCQCFTDQTVDNEHTRLIEPDQYSTDNLLNCSSLDGDKLLNEDPAYQIVAKTAYDIIDVATFDDSDKAKLLFNNRARAGVGGETLRNSDLNSNSLRQLLSALEASNIESPLMSLKSRLSLKNVSKSLTDARQSISQAGTLTSEQFEEIQNLVSEVDKALRLCVPLHKPIVITFDSP
ncbi:hypothetical protein GJ496_007718 [Pomphorhynchus laevis]|nr:hypothetical protein GJ496_007718 [Pomphorhynchus laevis]